MLFVRGPLVPARIPSSAIRDRAQEAQSAGAAKIARGTVIRAGFNTTWECLAAGTPFIPLIGITYQQPIRARVDRMASLGLVPPNTESFWFDDRWRAEYRRTAASIVPVTLVRPTRNKLAV